ncbi:hypothetical protein [Tenacibaculum sp. M341]|uniref:hypothetical protein n=1 Tax=Tenacibaculum sp. M341 TaxID=2530339 RepID=UPI00104A4BFC|nr:hypothetical protein [Tenacibaculum sp. M341]TCI93232.1 hypothetical protein EYW44_06345 [Tenacibaculum sp. M341]
MTKEDNFYFGLLKKEVKTTFLKNNSAPNTIEKWKGDEIIAFQEDLYAALKTKVSEKWFYTYFKNTPEKLPRVDMLNLLCKYSGVKDWNTFKNLHETKFKKTTKKGYAWYFLLVIPFLAIFWFFKPVKHRFDFCFVDNLKNEPITKVPLDIKIIQENESPVYFKTDSLGCFTYVSASKQIKFIVQSPYHKTDTIVRNIDSNVNQIIPILTDDYSLMLDYYTNAKVKDWQKHKKELEKLIADDAKIYQLFGNNLGVEIYSKDDFIRFVTTPTQTLKQVQILYKRVKKDKIVKLKFIVK